MASNQRHSVCPSLSRVKALLCLLAVLLGPAQLLPGLLAAAAAIEGSHTVRVGLDGADFRLVLSHERGTVGRSDYDPRHHPQHPAHCHGLASRVLCLMADRGGMEADHVAVFTAGSAWQNSQRLTEDKAQMADTKNTTTSESDFNFTAGGPTRFPAGLVRRPLVDAGRLRLLRSTVLLI